MDLTSLTYTSLARLDLETSDLEEIHRSARELNALDGITGLLIFNGTHFLQIVEGTHEAIDDLSRRLRRDPRHSGLEVRDERQDRGAQLPGLVDGTGAREGRAISKRAETIAERPARHRARGNPAAACSG